jgi:hypothetical protein
MGPTLGSFARYGDLVVCVSKREQNPQECSRPKDGAQTDGAQKIVDAVGRRFDVIAARLKEASLSGTVLAAA